MYKDTLSETADPIDKRRFTLKIIPNVLLWRKYLQFFICLCIHKSLHISQTSYQQTHYVQLWIATRTQLPATILRPYM